MPKQKPTCRKCGTEHWPFHGCPTPEAQPPGEVIYRDREGYHDVAFGESNMLERSLARAGFGAPKIGFDRPKRRIE